MVLADKQPEAPPPGTVVDEVWLKEWVAYGLAEFEISLAKHAAFDAYYEHRKEPA